MNTKRIDGIVLRKMLINGLNCIRSHEIEINKLNVFPVADGDTGTNMRLTLENGINYAGENDSTGKYLKALAEGMLLGARGNSGVILSQLFKGLSNELARTTTISAAELRNGLIIGYRTAYNSVIRPVEGTILTVARQGIENVRSQIGRSTTLEAMLSMYIAEMKRVLSATPEMLPVLKDAGVVDSGAMGYIVITEGMLKYLYGEIVEEGEVASESVTTATAPNLDYFDENSEFIDGYCTEFLLQLMNSNDYDHRFKLDEFRSKLEEMGESIVAVQDGKRVKVHIHSKKPDRIIAFAQQYGEFLTFKLENMQLQHNEQIIEAENEKPERKKLAVVSVADGDGMKQLFTDLGCDIVIDGGATMNPPAGDFLDAYNALNAECIVVLPNNKNAIGAADQAKLLYKGDDEIVVLKSNSMIDAYYAVAMDVRDSEDVEFRVNQMKSGIVDTHTLGIADASKAYSVGDVTVNEGDKIAVIDGDVVYASDDSIQTIIEGIKMLPDIDSKEVCMLVRGGEVSDDDEEELYDAFEEEFDDLEINIIYGGQHIYHWLVGLI